MEKSLFWSWIYKTFRREETPSNKKYSLSESDLFDDIQQEFLWIKQQQIQEKLKVYDLDSIWERNARLFFEQSFVDALSEESIGGNAGAGHTGVNAFYNPLTGEIKHFGNFQEMSVGRWDEVTGSTTVEGDFHCLFRVNVQHTGQISDVIFEQKPLSTAAQHRLVNLVGLQVMIPFKKIYQVFQKQH